MNPRDAFARLPRGLRMPLAALTPIVFLAVLLEEHRIAQGALERQNRELQQLDQMKDGLIRDVSHELKTPVAKYAMQLEILKPAVRKHRLSDEEEGAITAMEETVKRQESVIHSLLDLSRLEAGGRRYIVEKVRLDTLLEEVTKDYQYAVEAYGIVITNRTQRIELDTDRGMLGHLFSNLLHNSIKFRRPNEPARIVVATRAGENSVRVTIEDNGVGIDGEELPKLFERFYQVTVSSEGTGVGLAICRRIAEGLGGRVWLESGGRGRGATAVVELPLSAL